MGIIELMLIGLGLAMDAFAVAICKGLSINRIKIKDISLIGLWFGSFQAIMPVIGYYIGNTFNSFIHSIDNLIAFILLSFIGINMIKEAVGNKDSAIDKNLNFKSMLILSLATSIDALTVGITFAFFKINMLLASFFIGGITFITSGFGAYIGNRFGNKYEKKAQIMGGIILLSLAFKNLIEYFITE